MVVLTGRFTILAALCALVSISLPTPTTALPTSKSSHAVLPAHHTTASAPSSDKPVRQQTPLLPLPLLSMKGKAAGKSNSKAKDVKQSKKGKHQGKRAPLQNDIIWTPGEPFDVVDTDLWPLAAAVAVEKRHQKYFHHPEVIVDGKNAHVHINRHHYDHDDKKIIVEGKDAHVHLGRRHEEHDKKTIVEGKDAHIRVARRHDDHDDHHGHDDHDRTIVKSKDGHVDVHKRSLVISNNHGGTYIVPHGRRSHDWHHDVVVIKGNDAHVHEHKRRDQDGVPGTVDIMSPIVNSSTGTLLASLFLDSSNSTGNASLVLNASETNQTQFYLVAAPTSPPGPNVHVSLQVAMFDTSQAASVPYCATYDPSPPQAEPMTVEPCINGSSLDLHKSQTFAYTTETGVIKPMWFDGQDDGKTDDDDSDEDADQNPVTPWSANMANVTSAEDTGVLSRDITSDSSAPQNVTLVFTAAEPEVSSHADSVDPTADPSGASASVTTMTTTTDTETVATMTVTSTVDALDATTTTTSAAYSTPVANGDLTATPSLTSTATMSSTSAAASGSAGALNVEVGPSVTSMADAMSPVSPTTVSSNPASATSVDAEAIASNIAVADSSSASLSSSTTDTYVSFPATGTMTTVGATATAESVEDISVTSSAESATLTPVSTAPYQWMFKAETRL